MTRYVLRRFYWNGRTYVQLRSRADGDRRGWMEVLRDARARPVGAARQGRTNCGGRGATLMLAAAASAFALGAAVERLGAPSTRADAP